jgi:hypothetical protein
MTDAQHPTLTELLDSLEHEIVATVQYRAWVAAGSKGMHAPFLGDFSSAPPSTLTRLAWWVRELRAAAERESK